MGCDYQGFSPDRHHPEGASTISGILRWGNFPEVGNSDPRGHLARGWMASIESRQRVRILLWGGTIKDSHETGIIRKDHVVARERCDGA